MRLLVVLAVLAALACSASAVRSLEGDGARSSSSASSSSSSLDGTANAAPDYGYKNTKPLIGILAQPCSDCPGRCARATSPRFVFLFLFCFLGGARRLSPRRRRPIDRSGLCVLAARAQNSPPPLPLSKPNHPKTTGATLPRATSSGSSRPAPAPSPSASTPATASSAASSRASTASSSPAA